MVRTMLDDKRNMTTKRTLDKRLETNKSNSPWIKINQVIAFGVR